MTEPSAEKKFKRIISEVPFSKNISSKKNHLDLMLLLGEKLHNMKNFVKDESTDEKTEKVVLQGTQEETFLPGDKPFILRSGARAGCDASLLLEVVASDGSAHAAVTHWEPTVPERNAHTEAVSKLIEQSTKGNRFAVLVSGTIKGFREAVGTDLYKKMTEWNGGRQPDLVYIPFEGIDWSKIARETLYQLVLSAKVKDGIPLYEVSVPGTEYVRSFTPQSLPEVTNKSIAIRHEV